MIRPTLFLCASFASLTPIQPATAQTNAAPVVVPAVQQWRGGTGTYDASRAVFMSDSPALTPIARIANRDWGLKPVTASRIRLVLDPAFTNASPEAYAIEIGDGVNVRAATPQGVFYGTQTLLQMLAQDTKLPRGTIEDYPLCRRRMLMLDVGRKPWPLPAVRDMLRMMAWFKFNELHLHLNDEAFSETYSAFRVQSDVFPELASKDLFYTKQQIRDLQAYARAYGITITPEIDTPGHSAALTRAWPDLGYPGQASYLDVRKPETVARMKRLLDEMIPLFDAPDFHIGTDEYRVQAPSEVKAQLQEAFLHYINTLSAYVESKGKNCRIWFSPEHDGAVPLNPRLIYDMWNSSNAPKYIRQGHRVINSNEGVSYIVPGCHYYGVNNAHVYQNWKPWEFARSEENPEPSNPLFVGAKLHIWNDQGPTGYTLTEIALLARPSLMAFSQAMWGPRGFATYGEFESRTRPLQIIPGVTIFDRIPADEQGRVLNQTGEVQLTDASRSIALPYFKPRADLEYPWTLIVQVRKTAEGDGRGVLLSSDLVELCDRYTDRKDPKRRGLAWVRAAGAPGKTPGESFLSKDVSRVYADSLPLNQWVTLAAVGTAGRTTLYLNGEKIGEHNDQMVCPLARIGSPHGESFVGSVRGLKVFNRAFTPDEIRAASK